MKTEYVVKVLENKWLAPATIDKALRAAPDGGYTYQGMTVEIAGAVAKDGDRWVFTARASNQKFTLKVEDEDAKKEVADGRKLVLTGEVTEPEEKDGKKPPPVIEVTSAKEAKEEPKK